MVRNSFNNVNTQQKIIQYVKENPLASSMEINQALHVEMFKHFRTMKNLYNCAGVEYIASHKKRSLKIKQRIISYIQKNPYATQREVNSFCRTKVQEQFGKGIQEAYEQAGVFYPEERKKIYGAAKKEIKERAIKFEQQIVFLLKQRGKVFSQYRIQGGRIDAIFIEIDTIYAVEIKDYHAKKISQKDLQQLNRYIDSIPNCQSGLLITHKKAIPRKNKVYIGRNRISIVTKEDLSLLPPYNKG